MLRRAEVRVQAQEGAGGVSDREFWIVVYRALMAIAGAIEKKYIKEPASNRR